MSRSSFHPSGRPGEMPLMEDPARLSKSRLKSDLLAHNVALPPAKSRKEVYVELHLKHIAQRNAVEFSSDEEDRAQDEPVSSPGVWGVSEPSLRGLSPPGFLFMLPWSASGVLSNKDSYQLVGTL